MGKYFFVCLKSVQGYSDREIVDLSRSTCGVTLFFRLDLLHEKEKKPQQDRRKT